jgi:hypothetical protein
MRRSAVRGWSFSREVARHILVRLFEGFNRID